MHIQIFSDGGARGNPGPAGAGWIIKDATNILKKGSKFLGVQTNNQAEYQALIFALEDIQNIPAKKIHIFLDSELIVKQLQGEYRVKHPDLQPLFQKVQLLLAWKNWAIEHIPREKNKEADLLANQAMDKQC